MRQANVRRCGGWLVLSVALSATGCASPPGRGPALPGAERDLWTRSRDLLIRAVQNDDPFLRANAIEALVEVAPEDGRPYFRTLLDDDSPLVRFAAGVALGELRDAPSRPAVLRLLDDPVPRVRLAGAFAAYRLGVEKHAEVLVQALNSNPDEDMRADAAFLIGRLEEPAALARLVLAQQREHGPKATVQIIAARAALGDQVARDELIRRALETEPIAKLLALQELIVLRDPAARDALLYRLREEGDYVETRLLAARGLGRIGLNHGYDLAARSLSHTGDEPVDTMRVRSLAALALGAIGERRALPALERLAEASNDPRVQVAACYAICEILNRR